MGEEQKNEKLSKMSKEEIAEIGKILMEEDMKLYKDIMIYAEESRSFREKDPE